MFFFGRRGVVFEIGYTWGGGGDWWVLSGFGGGREPPRRVLGLLGAPRKRAASTTRRPPPPHTPHLRLPQPRDPHYLGPVPQQLLGQGELVQTQQPHDAVLYRGGVLLVLGVFGGGRGCCGVGFGGFYWGEECFEGGGGGCLEGVLQTPLQRTRRPPGWRVFSWGSVLGRVLGWVLGEKCFEGGLGGWGGGGDVVGGTQQTYVRSQTRLSNAPVKPPHTCSAASTSAAVRCAPGASRAGNAAATRRCSQ